MTNATPTKLRSGAWGATVKGTVRSGDQIQITTKSGKSWTTTVAKVVWTGKGVSIVATESAGSAASSPRGNGRRGESIRSKYRRRYGWDGVEGSSSYYTSGLYDEES